MSSWKEKGNVFFRDKNFKEAIRCFSEQLKVTPNDHLCYGNRSTAKGHLGDHEGSLEDADKATMLDPTYVKGCARRPRPAPACPTEIPPSRRARLHPTVPPGAGTIARRRR